MTFNIFTFSPCEIYTAKAKRVSAFLLVSLDSKNNYGAVCFVSLKHSPDSNNPTLPRRLCRAGILSSTTTRGKRALLLSRRCKRCQPRPVCIFQFRSSTLATSHFHEKSPAAFPNPNFPVSSFNPQCPSPPSQRLFHVPVSTAESNPLQALDTSLRPVLLFILPPFCPLPFPSTFFHPSHRHPR